MGEFPSGQRGQTVNLLSLTSMVRIHLLPPKEKGIRMDAFFRFAKQNFVREHRFAQMRQEPTVPPTNAPWPAATDGFADRCGGTSASLKCGRNLRFPHKRPLPDCGEGVGIQDTFLLGGGWLLLEAGCCGQDRRFAPMRQKPAVPSQSSRNSFLSKFLVRRQPQ